MLKSVTTDQLEAEAGSDSSPNQAAEHHAGRDSNLIPQRDAPSPSTTALLERIHTLEVTISKQEERLLKQRHLIRQKEEMISHLLGGAQPFDPDKCYYCGRSGGTELIVERPPSEDQRSRTGRSYFFTGEDADRVVPGNASLEEDNSIDDTDVEANKKQQTDTGRDNVEKGERPVGDEPDHSRDAKEAHDGGWAPREGAGSTQTPTDGW